MVLFAVRVDTNNFKPESHKFFVELDRRLSVRNILKNPFNGGVKRVRCGLYVIKMDPVYPRAWVFGLFWLASSLAWQGFSWSWWHLPGLVLSASWLLYSRYFYYWMLRRSFMDKAGGWDVHLVSDQEALCEVSGWGSKRLSSGSKRGG